MLASATMKKKPTNHKRKRAPQKLESGPSWTFLTNHAHVLLCLYGHPEMRLREVAQRVGITERMVQKIVRELEAAGFLSIEKIGRCNSYRMHTQLRLRHRLEAHHTIGELLQLLATDH